MTVVVIMMLPKTTSKLFYMILELGWRNDWGLSKSGIRALSKQGSKINGGRTEYGYLTCIYTPT